MRPTRTDQRKRVNIHRHLGGEMVHVSNLEKSLLAWCRQATLPYAAKGVDVHNFTGSWRDGLAFCALVHHFHPDALDWDVIAAKSAKERLDFVFGVISERLKISRLLDPEDLATADKKSIMTYVMCIFQVLPHDDIDVSVLHDVSLNSDPGLRLEQIVGSPLKTPIKDLTKGRNQYCWPLSFFTVVFPMFLMTSHQHMNGVSVARKKNIQPTRIR